KKKRKDVGAGSLSPRDWGNKGSCPLAPPRYGAYRKAMSSNPIRPTVGLLVSGGLDSCILLAHLLDVGQRVQPICVCFGHVWQAAELASLRRFLAALDGPRLERLTLLELPVADLYDGHWSVTGRGVPGAETPDEAVFLPGRNVLLIVKAAIWCGLRGI